MALFMVGCYSIISDNKKYHNEISMAESSFADPNTKNQNDLEEINRIMDKVSSVVVNEFKIRIKNCEENKTI